MHNDEDELITVKAACRILGGEEKPLHFSTYYRGVARGLYPPLVHPSPWNLPSIEESGTRSAREDHRGEPCLKKRKPPRKGAKMLAAMNLTNAMPGGKGFVSISTRRGHVP